MVSTCAPLDVRPARRQDEATLRRIIAAAFQQYDAVLPAAIFDEYLADLLDVRPRLDTADVLVAERDGEPVGTVTFYADGGGLGMSWPAGWSVFRALAVEPERRARGAGHALVRACIERAAAAGANVIGLHTATFMTSAVALYERCGFGRDPSYDILPTAILDLDLDLDDDDLPSVIAYRLDVGSA